jgi:hypothetical protein
MAINRMAPMFARREITISPLENIRRLRTALTVRRDWNPDIVRAELTTPIVVGSGFSSESGSRQFLPRSAMLCPVTSGVGL